MLSLLAGCGMIEERDRAPPGEIDISAIPDAVPKPETASKYGNPESYVINGRRFRTLKSGKGFVQHGIASWYGQKFHGRRTSSGEIYDMYQMTAAHTQLPLPSYVEVINLRNGRRVIVKVNDRGPFHDNRVIDLSYVAARKLDMLGEGTALVEVRAVESLAAPLVREPENPVKHIVQLSGLYMQIGAFRDRDNAESLRARVAHWLSVPVRVRQAAAGSQQLFRVQVGPVTTVELADRLVADLAKAGIAEHYFVSN